MPTPEQWREASAAMAQQMKVSPFYRLRSRLRHWWEAKKGGWRAQLRAWLGIAAEEERAYLAGVQTFQWWTNITNGLRADLDATNAAIVRENADILARVGLCEANLAELVRQFHQTAQGVDSHAKLLRAWRGIPMLAKAAREYQVLLDRNAADREARRVQELADAAHFPPVASVTQGQVDDQPTAPIAQLHQTADLVPIIPEASDAHQHPESD